MKTFVAFLRGINLGKRQIRMAELKTCFQEMGFGEARTLLASGNVLFEAEAGDGLAQRIEQALEKTFGFPVGVVLRTQEDLRDLVRSDPFGGLTEDDSKKLYVTFLAAPDARSLPMPCEKEDDFRVVHLTDAEVFTVAYRMPNGRYGLGMDVIGKHFEPRTLWTTRNWNTVVKAAEA